MSTTRPVGDPELDIISSSRDHMVDHPAGAHYALWNGPAFLDVGVPSGGFVRVAVARKDPHFCDCRRRESRRPK